ncbi:MAG TPA: TonB-dependent receptor [Rhizomicrobium sp.]
MPAAATLAMLFPHSAQSAGHIETVVVTATPLQASDDGPSPTQSVNAADLSRFGAADMLGALERNVAGVSLTNAQDNAFQPDLFYRGFEASPLAGDAQGLAVYANGARFNQPFGDTVNFDLLPDIAVSSMTLEGANPTFGLNALGGSLSTTFKNGFTFQGGDVQGSLESYGQRDAEGEFGGNDGQFSWYGTARILSDDGWRDFSPSNVRQAFADLGWRSGGTEIHAWFTGSDNALTGNGTSPVQLLAADRHAVFTWPDETLNRFGMMGLTAHSKLSDAFSFDASAYLSALRQHTLNGDASDLSPCGGDLCLDDGTVATDTAGNPIPDFLNSGNYAQLNQTATATTASGGSAQLSYAVDRLRLALGGSVDHGATSFAATSLVGELTPARGFAGPAIEIDIPGGAIAPVSVKGRNTYGGVYATGAFDIADGLTLTASARYNHAGISLADRRGTALNGDHRYSRLNPAVGLTYTASPALSFYAGYSEANRTPEPAELSCADAASPCSLTNFFVDDPDLKQVVAHTYDVGGRGSVPLYEGTLAWQADAYRTDLHNDILFVSSAIFSRAFFQNVAATRRQGFEGSLSYVLPDITAYLGYAYTDATFQTPLTLESDDNPLSDANGEIHVVPGDHMPGIPAQTAKAGFDYHPEERWSVSFAMRAASGQFLRGDESNLNRKTNPYAVFDVGARYKIWNHTELFGAIANLFDRKYETFGAFSPTGDVPLSQAPGATNPRSLSPAPPRLFEGGIRLTL